MHGFFESEELQIIVLFDNPNPISSSNIVYDTRSPGAKPELMSLCARVNQFRNCAMYSIPCKNQNVLIKVKNDGTIAARMGDAIDRVGLFGKVSGNRFAKDKLDYGTNIKTINHIKR